MSQHIREYNQQNLIQIFKEGCKQKQEPLRFGLELEHFVVYDHSMKSLPYYGEQGVEQLLSQLRPFYTETYFSEGHLVGLSRQDITISLEPAAQLEVSISPQQNVMRIQELYFGFYEEVEEILKKWNCTLVTCGYQPCSLAEELMLIPKNRYSYMDQYFEKIGIYGRQMMRGTAATQVSIDYYSEDDFCRKYKAALLLEPYLSELTKNTPVYEGKTIDESIFDGLTPRKYIWEHTDSRRVNITPYLKNGSIDFAGYSKFVMQTPVIVDQRGEEELYSEETIEAVFEKRQLNDEELHHMLSMVFPMIRLKNYIEIRIADSLPIDSVICYILMIKGLFTDIDSTLDFLQKTKISNDSKRQFYEALIPRILPYLQEEERKYVLRYKKEIENGTILK